MSCLNVKKVNKTSFITGKTADGLDDRLLTSFGLLLGSVVARPTCLKKANIKFQSGLSRFV